MNAATAEALSALNRHFYAVHAEEFSATRQAPWPGWERVLAVLHPQADGGALRVLDVGCGNGRFARFLAARLEGAPLVVEGVDASAPLLEHARRGAPPGCRFHRADAAADPAALPAGPFEAVVLWGVLHGVPGRARREALLRACATRVAPGGLLAFTLWRLEADARRRSRFLDWNAYSSRAPMPIDCSQLEPGDRLLPWGPGDEVLRYCHAFDEREIEDALAALGALGLAPEARFRADGRGGEQNEYLLLRRAG